MSERPHRLEFTVEAGHWDTAERYAANQIRAYTREGKRGPDARTDDEVLRDAEFFATPVTEKGSKLWRVTVRVAV